MTCGNTYTYLVSIRARSTRRATSPNGSLSASSTSGSRVTTLSLNSDKREEEQSFILLNVKINTQQEI